MISIDYQDKRPLYEQVVEKMQHLIVKGILNKDDKLPSVRALAIELSINPNTIQRAYAELEQSGFIYTVKGRGNFVSGKDGWIADEKKSILDNIRISVSKAHALGVKKDEISEIISSIYEEGKR
ncbi:MAG: GntR family transcriptional regulator [Lachnospiraceae bacterium]|nr:GntR family transcriptional regulator [Lachnospiraceae bacterium]